MGRNRVSRISHGCGLLEEWEAASGVRGTSVNHRDPETGRWHQLWVGGGGLVLRLEGGPEEGAMTLSGTRTTADGGRVTDRIRWTLLSDGRVEQRWDVSRDGGRTWEPAFLGFYEKAGGSHPAPTAGASARARRRGERSAGAPAARHCVGWAAARSFPSRAPAAAPEPPLPKPPSGVTPCAPREIRPCAPPTEALRPRP